MHKCSKYTNAPWTLCRWRYCHLVKWSCCLCHNVDKLRVWSNGQWMLLPARLDSTWSPFTIVHPLKKNWTLLNSWKWSSTVAKNQSHHLEAAPRKILWWRGTYSWVLTSTMTEAAPPKILWWRGTYSWVLTSTVTSWTVSTFGLLCQR
jgi:hypothetical protein